MTTIEEISKFALNEILTILKPSDSYRLVGYSFGSIIVTKVAALLEELGYQGKVLVIDGSPSVLSTLFHSYVENLGNDNIDSMILANIVDKILPEESKEKTVKFFSSIHDFEGRMTAFQKYVRRQKLFGERYITSQAVAVLQRCRLINEIDLSKFKRINAPICLVKPTNPIMANAQNDYGLKVLTNNDVTTQEVEGNHYTVLENPELTKIINEYILKD